MTAMAGRAAVAAALLLLGGCGSKPQEPVEQIIVRQPGAAATVAAPAPQVAKAAAAPAAVAPAAFAICLGCHAVTPGAAPKIGPDLYGVVGRRAGSLAGFAYSDAMKRSGLTWTDTELDAFLANPSGKVPGTLMAISGVQDKTARQAIIAFLGNLGAKK